MGTEKKATPSELIATAIDTLVSVRESVPMLFALKQVDECVRTRDAIRSLLNIVGRDTDDEMSLQGVFDAMCDMGKLGTWGPELRELERALPKRQYTKRNPAPAGESTSEETQSEDSTETNESVETPTE